jgi:hypothetical protein
MAKWIKIEKRLPKDDRQVFALSGSCAYLASYRDGFWWITHTIKLGGVTRWMDVPGEPKDFTYWLNRLREWWGCRKANAQQTSDWLTGWGSRKAQLDKKVTFYKDSSGRILTGMPENIPAPQGYEKVVCNNVYEAERFSEMQRRQEKVEHRAEQERRGAIEGEFQREIRSEMHTKMANARNAQNREFLRRALENNANRKDPTAYERESYLHAEAFEDKH